MTDIFKKILGENYEAEIKKQVTEEEKQAAVTSPAARAYMGIGRGATFGLTDVPAALALMGTRALTGGAPLSFGEAYREVKDINRQMQEMGPAYGLGELAGGVMTGGGLLPALGKRIAGSTATRATAPMAARALTPVTIPGAMGLGAGLGALSGATSTSYMEELPENIGIGALAGGTLTGAAQTTAIGMRKLGKNLIEKELKPAIDELTAERAKQFVKDNLQITGAQLSKIKQQATKDVIDQYSIASTMRQVPGVLAREGLQAIGPAVAGAGMGGLASIPLEMDPYTAALYGAGGAAALSKYRALQSTAQAGERIAARLGQQYSEPMARAGIGVATAGQYVLTSQLAEQLANARANEAAQEMMMRQQGQQ